MNELNPQTRIGAPTAQAERESKTTVDKAADATSDGKTLPQVEVRPAKAEQSQPVEQAVVALNDYVQSLQRDLKFTVDPELGRPVVSVVDSNTQKVIRQIPNDVAIRLARNLKDAVVAAGPSNSDGYSNAQNAVSQALNLIKTEV